ncbi:MAG TPA: sensor domain-containing protein [Mycobacteriales bacterium]
MRGDGLRRRLAFLGLAVGELGVAITALVLFVLAVVGLALVVVAWGVPLVMAVAAVTRPLAQIQRQVAGYVQRRPVDAPYLRRTAGGPWVRLRGIVRDPARRRDLYWLGLQGSVGLVLAILAVVEGVFDLLLPFVPAGFALKLDCWLSAALLGITEKSALALRVEELAESRAETVDTQAAELRRIERDLHDGAQARLVALGMSLSLAETQLTSDPEAARSLLVEARASSGAALAELRDLVRGIHPPVLADRGLVGAVQALALAAPLDVRVHADGVGPLPAPVEAAAYFAVAEGLTNVVKHAGARKAEIFLAYRDGELRLELCDVGVGGATVTEGGGLHGIERRLAAFDGRVTLDSPVGGPTRLHMVLPCVSSSPKTSPSSETG